MSPTTFWSWNVNGVRAIVRKGFLDILDAAQPDVLCLQEVKALPEDLPTAHRDLAGYYSLWQPAQKKGYSGVATYLKRGIEPTEVRTMGRKAFDDEGRVQALEFDRVVLINAYFPNSQDERARLDYKLAFCKAMTAFCNRYVKAGKHLILCGDYNIAHQEIDLARPKENQNSAGFYIEERQAMSRFLKHGYADIFREQHPEPGHYTWWSYRSNAREKNIGWRIDYHCVDRAFVPRVARTAIHADVLGSDHCPVELTLKP